MLFMNFYFHDDILLGFENDVFPPAAATAHSAAAMALLSFRPQLYRSVLTRFLTMSQNNLTVVTAITQDSSAVDCQALPGSLAQKQTYFSTKQSSASEPNCPKRPLKLLLQHAKPKSLLIKSCGGLFFFAPIFVSCGILRQGPSKTVADKLGQQSAICWNYLGLLQSLEQTQPLE